MRKIRGYYQKTGDFARLAGLNPRTLHYYDEIGIFRPSYVEENGYRYYGVDQLDHLALIVTLRDLGVSLKDIGSCLEGGDVQRMNDLLSRQEKEIDNKIARLLQKKQLLQHTLQCNLEYDRYLDRGYVRLQLPRQPWDVVLNLGRILSEKKPEEETSVVNYLTDGPYLAMYLSHREDGERLLIQYRTGGERAMEQGDCLCSYRTIRAGGDQMEQALCAARAMHKWAEEQGILLEDCTYVEYNDHLSCMSQNPELQYICLRSGILRG